MKRLGLLAVVWQQHHSPTAAACTDICKDRRSQHRLHESSPYKDTSATCLINLVLDLEGVSGSLPLHVRLAVMEQLTRLPAGVFIEELLKSVTAQTACFLKPVVS